MSCWKIFFLSTSFLKRTLDLSVHHKSLSVYKIVSGQSNETVFLFDSEKLLKSALNKEGCDKKKKINDKNKNMKKTKEIQALEIKFVQY